ncbi:MAG: ABC transporter substrate-binding protein [Tidjanibacter sp.]|nr:ABC transporter substrate-binding protein [Tidjanibacter sp.]
MQRIFGHILLIVTSLLLVGCPAGGGSTVEWGESLYEPHFSTGFEIVATEGASTVLRILSPWPDSEGVVREVFVARDGEKAPEGFDGTVVQSSPDRVVVMSSSHIAFIDALGAVETIVGISGSPYISNHAIVEGVERGAVREVGYDANINYEVLASLGADVVFIYGTTGENGAMSSKLEELGIPYVYISDHTETTPLGKSEWVVAFGEIFDCRAEAVELFEGIAERYEGLRLRALDFEGCPKVMLNSPYKDIWFVPADDSYVVRLIEDAGGDYVCKGDKRRISRPISGENAYLYLSQADRWLHPNSARTIAELVGQNPKFADVRVVRERGVYNCTALSTPAGGSDFWESGALRADVVLADMIKILHPEEMDGYELHYYEQLR